MTKPNYLAGSLLFDKDNRSLSVTSLLNDPYGFYDVLDISENGNITSLFPQSDITQDIAIRPKINNDGVLYFNMFNEGLNTFIGTMYF